MSNESPKVSVWLAITVCMISTVLMAVFILALFDWEKIRNDQARLAYLEGQQEIYETFAAKNIDQWCIDAYENGWLVREDEN